MREFIAFIPALLICHQIVTIYTYIQLKREDKGIEKPDPPKFIGYLKTAVLSVPFVIDAVYEYTLGLVDRWHSERLCHMLADRDDKIKSLERQIDELQNRCRP